MQNQGTYIEQFLQLEKLTHYDVDTSKYGDATLKVAMLVDYFIDDNGYKSEIPKIRLECDDKLIFLSDAKALLMALEIIKKVAEKSDEDVIGLVRKLLNDMEVEE